jgi:lipid A 3-O-deacylase
MIAIGLVVGLASVGIAETPEPVSSAAGTTIAVSSSDSQISGRWELGPTGNFGFGAGDRSGFYFCSVGFQVGRVLTPVISAGPFSGRFEAGVDVVPFWQAYTPAAHNQTIDTPNGPVVQRIGGGTYTGASVSPVVWRWDFAPHSQKYMPWAQASAGVLYTMHKFPPTIEVPEGTPGGTSVFNFRSGGGFGVHYFTKPKRSVDFLVLAEHISSASLGDRNPGINASVQLFVGYTWWK